MAPSANLTAAYQSLMKSIAEDSNTTREQLMDGDLGSEDNASTVEKITWTAKLFAPDSRKQKTRTATNHSEELASLKAEVAKLRKNQEHLKAQVDEMKNTLRRKVAVLEACVDGLAEKMTER